MRAYLLCAIWLSTINVANAARDLEAAIAADYSHVEQLYKHLHANPELSFKEEKTSALVAAELEELGFDVTTRVGDAWIKALVNHQTGRTPPGVGGYGVVAVMENGEGPTVLIRADMDALPLKERTGLPYASEVTGVDYRGVEAPVMHACGHDIHMASMIGAARRLSAMKNQWNGTLVLVAQPAEEITFGALAIIDDGLFTRFPRPDYNLALHVGGGPAGSLTYVPGYAMAAVDTVDLRVKGRGGHGASPHLATDPIVISAQIVMALQTLVSRELDPQDAGVVTVGALNSGYKHNIISDEAHLQITVRSYTDEVRATLLDGIHRIAAAQSLSAGMPEDQSSEVIVGDYPLPSTYNDPELVHRISSVLKSRFGEEWVKEGEPVMGGEDFSYFGRTEPAIPSFIFRLGGGDPQAIDKWKVGAGPQPASNHSPFFAPLPEPTLKAGIEALTIAALSLFAPSSER